MKEKFHILKNILIFLLAFASCINIVFAGFKLGGCSLPIDEEGFIEYDWEDNFAPQSYKIKVEFVKLYQYEEIIRALGANVSVSKYNVNTSTYVVMNVDNLEFQNQLCLLYNKTDQFFKFDDSMNNLLLHGYGGYFIIPDDPVDINIVKVFIESYTLWSANVSDNTIIIDIGNDQAILTYNKKGILVNEVIKHNNEIISSLTIIKSKDNPGNLVLIISAAVIITVVALFIPILIKVIKRK
ncbi:MAG: hypothetical protein ACFFA3_19550 [Promethearchaeota archaeon]